jgi:CRP-like cAMP-binding protein
LNRFGSLNALRARSGTIARQSAQIKAAAAEIKGGGGGAGSILQTTFRLARIGPGWVIGDQEALLGGLLASSSSSGAGTTIAVDECRLHYISYDKLDQVEKENPMLILQLYKLLSKLHALRSEVTIAQLATMHSIMSAPAHNRPLIVTPKNPFMRYS